MTWGDKIQKGTIFNFTKKYGIRYFGFGIWNLEFGKPCGEQVVNMPLSRRHLDPRDMKSAYVVSDENGYYDSQNIINVYDKILGKQVLSCILHHSRNHEGGKGRDSSSISRVSWFIKLFSLLTQN